MLQSTRRAVVVAFLVASVALAPVASAAPWLDLAGIAGAPATAAGWLWNLVAWAWGDAAPAGGAGAPAEKGRWLIDPLGDDEEMGEQGRWLIDPLG